MHRVTIERNCDDDGYMKFTAGTDDPDGIAIGHTIGNVAKQIVPRPLECLAWAIWMCSELTEEELTKEERVLVDAAEACVNAWDQHDAAQR